MLIDLLKSRRSIRKYQQRPVEKEKVDTILKGALTSPSARNRRPCELIAVTDKGLLTKLSKAKAGSDLLGSAPFGIVVIADAELANTWVEDASIISTTIQLLAHDQGLGSCWIHMRDKVYSDGISSNDYIKQLLGIPDKYQVLNIIAIGYPDEKKDPHDINVLPVEKLHYDMF